MAWVCLAFIFGVWSSLANPVFVHIDPRGLPEPAVMSLAQDSAGFIWVGTQGGLARYDGYHFRNYLPDPSDPHALPDGYLRTLLADPHGGIWIGSSTNGVVHYDPVSDSFRSYRPSASGGPRSAEVDALAAAGNGDVWVGGDKGLDLFDPVRGTFQPQNLNGRAVQPVVWCALVDRRGTLWAGTQDGLYFRSARSRTFTRFKLAQNTVIYSLLQASSGDIWAGSSNAVYVIDAAGNRSIALTPTANDENTLAPGQQFALVEPRRGIIWAGTDNAISLIDVATHRIRRIRPDTQTAGGLTSGRAIVFLRDRSGLIWIANHIGGLLLYNPDSPQLSFLASARRDIGPTGNGGAVALAAEPNGRLWAGGLGGSLVELDPKTGRTASMTLPNDGAIQVLVRRPSGALWIGTTNGLCELQPHAEQAECPAGPAIVGSEQVYTLFPEGSHLWIGGSNGVIDTDLQSGAVRTFSYGNTGNDLTNNQVRFLLRDRKHRMWIGTENGFNRLDPSGKVTRFSFDANNPNSVGPGGVAAFLEDRRGRIWAGMNGGPLNVLQENADGSYRVRRISTKDGLPHENVDALAEGTDGSIWVSTDKGIARIDPNTLKATAFGMIDGVSEAGYWAGTVTRWPDGTIAFGALDGITMVAPGSTRPAPFAPPIVATAIQIGRKDVSAGTTNFDGSNVILPAGDRNLSVEFAALDYAAPLSTRYSYRLDGYDRDWVDVDATHRFATYTQLPPGTRTLEIRSSDRSGNWSTRVLRISVRAQPHWYETWVFRSFLVLLAAAALYGAHRLRMDLMRRRQRELETLVDDRTRELSDANARLHELSLNDPLTGLRNRRYVASHLESDVAASLLRYERAASNNANPPHDADLLFFIIDLDYFKMVNDQFGHSGGDLVLTQMKERLQEVFRGTDFVARWGGDEFLAVARHSDRAEAAEIAERIRTAVAGRPFSLGGSGDLSKTCSIGFAAFPFIPTAPHAVAWSQVVDLADYALYIAKNRGRDTWCGLASTTATDAEELARSIAISAEEAVRTGSLNIVQP